MSPLALAFVGDAVYELYVRNYILNNGSMTAGMLHKSAIKYVCAQGQAYAINSLMDKLNEDENYFYKRGRNAWSPSVPKNCSVIEYRKATGLECLIGFLHLIGEQKRVEELMEFCVDQIENKEDADNGEEKKIR